MHTFLKDDIGYVVGQWISGSHYFQRMFAVDNIKQAFLVVQYLNGGHAGDIGVNTLTGFIIKEF